MTDVMGGASPGQPDMAPIHTFFHRLWEDPLVCVVSSGWTLRSGVAIALAHARGRPCHILVRPSWRMLRQLDMLGETHAWLKANHPGVSLTSMATTPEDVEAVASRGVAAIHAHNLAFIDEQIYFPEPGVEKIYDAAHIARACDFKRHPLAYGVPNLALITYRVKDTDMPLGELAALYRDLKYINWSAASGHQWLDGAATRRVVSQSRCGLILSEEEGPNNATMEYLLCGVPVVTTPSTGGRHVMFDPRHVSIVGAEPRLVEAAVKAFAARPPDPEEVRASALAKALPHRARLIAWLSAIVDEDLMPRADASLWLPQFCDKLREEWVLQPKGDGTADGRRASGPARPRS
jgi:hypothetical protein